MNKFKLHLLGIGIYTTAVGFVDFVISKNIELRFFAITLLLELLTFYTCFCLLYFTFLRSPKFFFAGVFTFLTGIGITVIVYEWYFNLKNGSHIFDEGNLPKVFNIYIRFSLYAVGYFFFERSLQNQQKASAHEKSIIIAEKESLKKENIILQLQEQTATLNNKLFQSETNFLRAQINPHFLQNCLNFLYSDTRKTNPDAAEAILLLSDLMRYSVADNSATDGMALLADEVTNTESIIKIHQLRFKNSLNIIFEIDGNITNKHIVPMIFLTLVENVIKYADLNDKNNPAKINCTVDEAKKMVFFSTANKKAFSSATTSLGLGLKNIKERLSLVWNNNFTLEKEDQNHFFKVTLSMPYLQVVNNDVNIKPAI
jgi:two-component system, LytTR family, sensor kinase